MKEKGMKKAQKGSKRQQSLTLEQAEEYNLRGKRLQQEDGMNGRTSIVFSTAESAALCSANNRELSERLSRKWKVRKLLGR